MPTLYEGLLKTRWIGGRWLR